MSTLRWFAIRTKPRHEKAVSLTLAGKGYEQFLPVYSSRGLGSTRKPVSLPLFAGYLFCRFDVEDRLPILITPGVFNIVGCGRVPIALDDVEVANLQSVVRAGIAPQPWPFLKVGHRVRITRGALEGVEGVLVKSKSVDRLIVSVTLLQRSVAVEIDTRCVEAATVWSRPEWTVARAGVAGGARGFATGR
ncbi:MAG TPA: transcription termination/antitermination NusG family protein [Burkholderiales bacterium]|nr:transcription termination/antitermination NusG family protein [Burkholderiales bacterium]